MTYLLDTNVISEVRRERSEPRVIRWLAQTAPHDLKLSVISLGEIERGVWLLGPTPRRAVVESFLREVKRDFQDRLLMVDELVASHWGRLSARYRREKVNIAAADELIAATALAHNLTLVTRNTRDFEQAGVKLLDPWSA